jgi:peptidoglycan/LPS O-acetylase OafA/YrhL
MALQFGVELFFGISGLVITLTLMRSPSVWAFVRNRAVRILPVLWATVLLVTMLSLATGTQTAAELPRTALLWVVPANLLALPGILPLPLIHPPAWSLSYELLFYCVAAAGWWQARRRGRWAVALAIIVGLAVCLVRPRALFFLSGLLLIADPAVNSWFHRLGRWPATMLVLFLASWSAVELIGGTPIIEQTVLGWVGTWQLPLAVLAFASATAALAGIERGQGWLGAVLRTPLMLWLGTISYSLYLWHPVVLAGIKRAMDRFGLVDMAGPASQLLLLLLALPVALAVSHVSQQVLEVRLARMLRRRASVTSDPPASATHLAPRQEA